jgi:hypothetical protein
LKNENQNEKRGRFKCDQTDCNRTFVTLTGLGSHKRAFHGILGTSPSTVKAREKVERESTTPPLTSNQCPHCPFIAKGIGPLKLHLRKKHADLNPTPKPGKEKSLVKRTTKAITLNGHAQENGQDHSNANGIPDALVAVASGRFTEICRSMAFEFDLPPRMFTARVAALVYATTVR